MRSLALLLLLTGCSAETSRAIDAAPAPVPAPVPVPAPAPVPAPVPAPAPPPLIDDPWFYADVTREREAPPAQLMAPMKVPLRAQDFEALCALDPWAMGQYDKLSQRDRDELAESLANCGENQWTPHFCADARAIVDGGDHPARGYVKSAFETSCRDRAPDVAIAYDTAILDGNWMKLRLFGLLDLSAPPPAGVGSGLSAQELLELGGKALGFDTEMPDTYAHVARRLARLCSLDVVFDEPTEHALDAWVRGQHLRVKLRDLDDWYDVRALVGLLNEVSRTEGSNCRLIVLPNDGQEAFVAGGPGDGLVNAIRYGLLTTADPDAARRAGVAVE